MAECFGLFLTLLPEPQIKILAPNPKAVHLSKSFRNLIARAFVDKHILKTPTFSELLSYVKTQPLTLFREVPMIPTDEISTHAVYSIISDDALIPHTWYHSSNDGLASRIEKYIEETDPFTLYDCIKNRYENSQTFYDLICFSRILSIRMASFNFDDQLALQRLYTIQYMDYLESIWSLPQYLPTLWITIHPEELITDQGINFQLQDDDFWFIKMLKFTERAKPLILDRLKILFV